MVPFHPNNPGPKCTDALPPNHAVSAVCAPSKGQDMRTHTLPDYVGGAGAARPERAWRLIVQTALRPSIGGASTA